jgi:hypothetical protein
VIPRTEPRDRQILWQYSFASASVLNVREFTLYVLFMVLIFELKVVEREAGPISPRVVRRRGSYVPVK